MKLRKILLGGGLAGFACALSLVGALAVATETPAAYAEGTGEAAASIDSGVPVYSLIEDDAVRNIGGSVQMTQETGKGAATNVSIHILANSTASITLLSDINIDNSLRDDTTSPLARSPIYIEPGATLNIYLNGHTMTLKGGQRHCNTFDEQEVKSGGSAGIYLPEGARLNVYGDGTLAAIGGNGTNCVSGAGGGAGIGTHGSYPYFPDATSRSRSGTLVIYSGTVKAQGGSSQDSAAAGAGVGGGGAAGSTTDPYYGASSQGATYVMGGSLTATAGQNNDHNGYGSADAIGSGGGWGNGMDGRGDAGRIVCSGGTITTHQAFASKTSLGDLNVGNLFENSNSRAYNGVAASSPSVSTKGSGDKTLLWYKKDGGSWKQLDSAPSDAGKYRFVAIVEQDNAYWGQAAECEFTITKRELSGFLPVSKVYDGSKSIPASAFQFYQSSPQPGITFVLPGDKVSFVCDSAEFEDANVGMNKTITVKNPHLTGEDAANYGIASGIAYRGSITQAQNSWMSEPTISDWVYGGVPSTPSATPRFGDAGDVTFYYSDKEGGAYSATMPADAHVGTWYLRAEVAGTSNYASLTQTVSFTIEQADDAWSYEPKIEGWTYGETPNAPRAEANSGEEVTFSYSDSEDGTYGALPAKPHAGTWYMKASTSGEGNYEKLELVKSFTVEKASLSGFSASASLTRKQPNATATVDLSRLVPEDAGGTVSYEVESFTKNGLTSATVDATSGMLTVCANDTDSTQGDTVTVKLSGMQNYADTVVSVSVSYTDKPQALISVTPQDAVYDGKGHAGYTGDIRATYGDDTYAGSFEVVYRKVDTGESGDTEPSAELPTDAGIYAMTVSVPYDEESCAGSVTYLFEVEQRELAVEGEGVSKMYDGTTDADMPELALAAGGEHGVVSGDTVELDLTQASAAYDSADVEGATKVIVTGALLTGEGAGNYRLPDEVSVGASITQSENAWIEKPTIEGWTYGDTVGNPSAAVKFGTVLYRYVSPDGEELAELPERPVVGSWALLASVEGTANYTGLAEVEVPFEVKPRELVVTAADAEMTEGDGLPELSYTVTGLLEGDSLSVEPELSVEGDASEPGAYAITASGAETEPAGCYDIAYVDGTLTVHERSQSASGEGGDAEGSGGLPSTGDVSVLLVPVALVGAACVAFGVRVARGRRS